MDIPLTTIDKIQFYVLSPLDIDKLAEVEVKNHFVIQDNIPVQDGIYDLHMGTTTNIFCKTCKEKNTLCPGHYGKYKLRTRIIHPLYIPHVNNILKKICFNCARFINKKSKCIYCGETQPLYRQMQNDRLILLVNKKKLLPYKIYELFARIVPEDLIPMGFPENFHPTFLIPNVILIPPNTIRPEIQIVPNKNSSHSMTLLVQDVVKINNSLPMTITDDVMNADLEKQILLLNIAVYKLINGPYINDVPAKDNNIDGSIMNQIPSKSGIIRHNVLGKNTWGIARSIIICNPDLPNDTVGISKFIATRIPKKVHVQRYNYEQCLSYYKNGTKKYPGASKIKKATDSFLTNVDYCNKSYEIKIGDILYRDLIDGDIVNFNRQPTLDRSSISSLKTIILDGESIQMNVNICKLFHADFDGDEMNLQIPFSTFTEVEIAVNSSIDGVIISSKNSRIQVSSVLDGVVGLRMLTYNNNTFTNKHLLNIPHKPLDFSLNKKNNSYDIITSYFQSNEMSNINYKEYSALNEPIFKSFYMYDDPYVEIKNGQMMHGVLDKPIIGEEEKNNIFHIIYTLYGYKKIMNASYDLQQIALKYLNRYDGFTISYKDFYVNKTCRKQLNESINSSINEAIKLTSSYREDQITPLTGLTHSQDYEARMMAVLALPELNTKLILKYTPKNNNFIKSVAAGGKGKIFNLTATRSAIGLITLNGEIVKDMFSQGRITCYGTRFDDNMLMNGFVTDSYIEGLNPISMIFHTAEARNSFITKGLATAESGTRQRQDRKCLEAFIVNNRYLITSDEFILQFLFGNDGMSPAFYTMDNNEIFNHSMSKEDFENTFLSKHNDPVIRDLLLEEFNYLKKIREKYILTCDYKFKGVINLKNILNNIPLSAAAGTNHIIGAAGTDKQQTSQIKEMILAIREFISRIYSIYYNEEYDLSNIPFYIKNALKQYKYYILSYLNIATLKKYSITNVAQLECIFQQIKMNLIRAILCGGTAIGSITTMHVNEPIMQQLLDSHRMAGSGGKGTQRNIMDKINEIFSVKDTTNSQYVNMKIFFNDSVQYDKYKISRYSFELTIILLRNICIQYQIINEVLSKSDNKDYQQFVKITELHPSQNITPLCIKLLLNVDIMILHNITLEHIYKIIQTSYPDSYIYYNSRLASSPQYIKIFLSRVMIKNILTIKKIAHATLHDLCELVENDILSITLKGMKNISSSSVNSENIVVYENDTIINKEIYYIQTDGTNISDALKLPNVDKYKIFSYSIVQTYKLFGIIAARNIILENLKQILSSIDVKHLTIYADLMTLTGACTSIDRYGAKYRNDNILTRVSDASPKLILIEAGFKSIVNNISQLSDSILIGQTPEFGDNYNSFELDLDIYKESDNSLNEL